MSSQDSVKQTIRVVGTEAVSWFKSVQEAIIRGARYKEKTYPSFQSMPFIVEMEIDVPLDKMDKVWDDNGPIIFAVPLDKNQFIYSREQLEEMEWNTLKKVVGYWGISGRERNTVINLYLKATGQDFIEE